MGVKLKGKLKGHSYLSGGLGGSGGALGHVDDQGSEG